MLVEEIDQVGVAIGALGRGALRVDALDVPAGVVPYENPVHLHAYTAKFNNLLRIYASFSASSLKDLEALESMRPPNVAYEKAQSLW